MCQGHLRSLVSFLLVDFCRVEYDRNVRVTGKKLLWRALAVANLPQLNGYDFEELQRHARQQIERIEAERIRAVRDALAGTSGLQ